MSIAKVDRQNSSPKSVARGRSVTFYLIHVQTGYRISLLFVDGLPRQYVARSSGENHFTAVDWGTVVSVPPLVAFKGNNGKYLRYYKLNNRPPYMQFASDDPKESGCIQTVYETGNGYIRIKCNGGFWRLEPDWKIPDSPEIGGGDTMYEPFRGENGKIALLNRRNRSYCRSLTAGGLTDTLNARADTMIDDALFEVVELVSNRDIEVDDTTGFRMDQLRVFNEQPYLAGQSTVRNDTGNEATQTVTISYSKDLSYTFSRGFSTTASVETTIKSGVPLIAEAGVTIGFSITGTFSWDTTTSESQSLQASTTVVVPPRSAVRVNYVATQGTCSIPYNYTQRDRSSITGQILETRQVDGIYTGVSCYNFDFQIEDALPL
ncbi:hypothetical protein OROHE_007346 [Orobanche hederae]